MEAQRRIEFILGVSASIAVFFLIFELYWFLFIPIAFVAMAVSSKRFTVFFVEAFKKMGRLVSGLLTKLALSILFLFILLPIAITQGIISKF